MRTRRNTLSLPAGDTWLSARQAAAALGLSRLALYERALDGLIAHAKVAGRRVFSRADVERLNAQPEPAAA